jgi:hypothetical protein
MSRGGAGNYWEAERQKAAAKRDLEANQRVTEAEPNVAPTVSSQEQYAHSGRG